MARLSQRDRGGNCALGIDENGSSSLMNWKRKFSRPATLFGLAGMGLHGRKPCSEVFV